MIIGRSPVILRALALVERFASRGLPFLLVGQTGTGKELFAEHIHRLTGRAGPLVDVNCGALPREMVESLLFGHRRGAFTGANESVQGHIERADGGTLFLDEMASLAPEGQVTLLRVFETRTVQPLGDGAKRHVDFQLVSAVHETISDDVQAGRFRRDLYQRVAGVVIELPPLSGRAEDIVPLARHFAAQRGQELEPAAERVLLNYSWPGNVRELRLAIERAGQLVDNGTLPPDAVAEGIALGAPAESGKNADRLSRCHPALADPARVVAACEGASWCVTKAARHLGVSRAALYRRLRALGVRAPASHRLVSVRRDN
jgi:transcriptional regulator with PAS, ATPase and Fis domain